MNDRYNLKRFLTAQKDTYDTALNEIKNGKKVSHWMWYIFPQLAGIGKRKKSEAFAIKSIDEAKEYINHDVLGERLVEISHELLKINKLTAKEIFGYHDTLKLKSSMTLYSLCQNEEKIFNQVLAKYFDGELCYKTVKLLKKI